MKIHFILCFFSILVLMFTMTNISQAGRPIDESPNVKLVEDDPSSDLEQEVVKAGDELEGVLACLPHFIAVYENGTVSGQYRVFLHVKQGVFMVTPDENNGNMPEIMTTDYLQKKFSIEIKQKALYVPVKCKIKDILKLKMRGHSKDTLYLKLDTLEKVETGFDLNFIMEACNGEFKTRQEFGKESAGTKTAEFLKNSKDVGEKDRNIKLNTPEPAFEELMKGELRQRILRPTWEIQPPRVVWSKDDACCTVYCKDALWIRYQTYQSPLSSGIWFDEPETLLKESVVSAAYVFDRKGVLKECRIFGPKDCANVRLDEKIFRKK